MDSSLCLALACQKFAKEEVLSVSFAYQQRHNPEVMQAAKICRDLQTHYLQLPIDCLAAITREQCFASLLLPHPKHTSLTSTSHNFRYRAKWIDGAYRRNSCTVFGSALSLYGGHGTRKVPIQVIETVPGIIWISSSRFKPNNI